MLIHEKYFRISQNVNAGIVANLFAYKFSTQTGLDSLYSIEYTFTALLETIREVLFCMVLSWCVLLNALMKFRY